MSRTTDRRPQAWFRRYRQVAWPRLRLVGFPHAGGAPHLFRSWPARLPSDVELLAVCYPGRHDRLAEPVLDRMEPLADQIARALGPFTERPLGLFGHSFGALVAYEVAVRLGARGAAPAALFVSAHPAPGRTAPADGAVLTDEELLHEVAGIGGLPPAVLADPRLRELVMPAIRADYEVLRTYRPEAPAVIEAPIVGYCGDDDPVAGPADLTAWAALTTGRFDARVLPGGHFYLTSCEDRVVADVHRRLELHAGSPTPGRRCPDPCP